MSGGTGPAILKPAFLAMLMAGVMIVCSSLPNIEFSPACGFNPATTRAGSLMPNLFFKEECVVLIV